VGDEDEFFCNSCGVAVKEQDDVCWNCKADISEITEDEIEEGSDKEKVFYRFDDDGDEKTLRLVTFDADSPIDSKMSVLTKGGYGFRELNVCPNCETKIKKKSDICLKCGAQRGLMGMPIDDLPDDVKEIVGRIILPEDVKGKLAGIIIEDGSDSLEDIFVCSSCKAKLSPDDKSCQWCGAPVK